jgi:Plavaka transposase
MRYQTDNDSCDEVPWKTANEMYESIDSISAGGPGWTTFELSYGGPRPDGAPPRWMQESYELNVRDILSVFEEQLASKEFDGQFEYMPYEEYDQNGSRVYSNLMSGNWAFREAVCTSAFHIYSSDPWLRTRFLKMRTHVDQCSFRLSPAVTRRQYQLQQGTKNITLYTYHSVTSLTLLGVDMGMA